VRKTLDTTLPDPVAHDTGHSREAPFTHLTPQLAGIVTAFLPALIQKFPILLDRVGPENWFPFGEAADPCPATDSSPINAQQTRGRRL
jgi:hypothetical protein